MEQLVAIACLGALAASHAVVSIVREKSLLEKIDRLEDKLLALTDAHAAFAYAAARNSDKPVIETGPAIQIEEEQALGMTLEDFSQTIGAH